MHNLIIEHLFVLMLCKIEECCIYAVKWIEHLAYFHGVFPCKHKNLSVFIAYNKLALGPSFSAAAMWLKVA